jgi:hypothetical protein
MDIDISSIELPKTDRVIDLLDDLGELEAAKAVLLSGPYTPDYVASQAQDLTFQIAEIAGEIVQIVKDLEEIARADYKRRSYNGL